MATPDRTRTPRPRASNLRWCIGGLLFTSTVINSIDRQTLSVLAPYLKAQYRWTNSDFALKPSSKSFAIGWATLDNPMLTRSPRR